MKANLMDYRNRARTGPLWSLITVVVLSATILACGDGFENGKPGLIRIGVLPDQSRQSLISEYSPLIRYLIETTSLDIELVIPDGYQQLLDDFHSGRLDMANFGGLTFTQAESRSGAEPLIMRDVDLRFTSCFITRSSSDRRSVSQFEGRDFAFGPRLSTSGHLMPRHFLTKAGIDPERFFSSVHYSAGHDETTFWVRDGRVALGVTNCVILGSLFAARQVTENDVRIVETTPAYPNYVWAVQESMRPSVKILLRDAFLALDARNPEHRSLLQHLGAGEYMPARRGDFEDVRIAAATQSSLEASDRK